MSTHSLLTGAELHEPKGVAAALAGYTYVADGAGGGAWTLQQPNSLIVPVTEADLGTDMGSYIQMPDDTMFIIQGTLASPFTYSKELRYGANTVIQGLTPDLSVMKYTGSGNALNCLNTTCRLTEVTVLGVSNTAGVGLNVDNSGVNAFIFMENVRFQTIGTGMTTVVGPGIAIIMVCSHVDGVKGFTYSGANNGTLLLRDMNYVSLTDNFVDLGTSTWNDIRITEGTGTPASGKAAISGLASSGNLVVGGIGKIENYNIDKTLGGVTFSGITTADTSWTMRDNRGEANSAWLGGYHKDSGRTNTVLITSTPVKVAGISTADPENERWDDDGGVSNRLRYTDSPEHKAFFTGTIIGQSSGGSSITANIIVRKNGTTDSTILSGVIFPTGADSSFTFHKPNVVEEGDFFELFVERTSGSQDLDCASFGFHVIRID